MTLTMTASPTVTAYDVSPDLASLSLATSQGDRVTLTAEKLRRHRFAFPPKTEQEAIALHLDTTLNDLEQAVERANHTIDLLREYRTRLIADVVTGKLDVVDVELPALDEIEAPEDWETDEDNEADEMDEMEGVTA